MSSKNNIKSLSKLIEIKISNIKYETNLSGFYQFNNKEEAISIINLFHNCMNDNGTFKKNETDACCDPRYQQLSAAIDYYKFGKIRPNLSRPKKYLSPDAKHDLDNIFYFD